MEELSESLAASFQISDIPNDTSTPHPRLSEYKIKPSNIPDQETRRKRILEEQKSRRNDRVNYARRLVEEVEMETEDTRSDQTKKTTQWKKNPFKNQLMMSEWLVDLPTDFEHQWIMVISPIGKRCLVVASRGRTTAYTKSGYAVNRFQSLLPGGCRDSSKPSDYTLMDCIYSELNRTFYMLDVMCWRGLPVYDSESEFRFYWLTTKLSEQPELAEESKQNPYKFVAAEACPCDCQSIYDTLSKERHYQIDGVLFYHKQAHYTPGHTPLVGWLKVFMIPEIIEMNVPERYMENVPMVHKLTMRKENQKFQEKEKKEKKEDEMEVDKSRKSRKQKKSSKEMIVDESAAAERGNEDEME